MRKRLKLNSTGSLVKRANSKQPLKNYVWNSQGPTTTPDASFHKVKELIDQEPVATGAIQTFVDKAVEGGWSVINWENMTRDLSTERKFRYKHRFDTRIIRMLFKTGKLFKNAFLEIVRGDDGVTPVDYNVLDPTNIKVVTKANGDPIRYYTQYVNPETGDYGQWDAKDIVWFKFDNIDNGWAPVDIKSLYNVLLQKKFINRFITWCWETGQYRVIHNFKTTDETVVQDFIAYNSKVDNDFTKPFIASGDYKKDMLRDMEEIENLNEYLSYLDSQILGLLRVPSIDMGMPDASGRSNADAMTNSFNAHVNSFKEVIVDGMNEFFQKINKGTNALVFGPVDRFSEKMVLEVILRMRQSGFSDEAVKEYLFNKGIVWNTEMLFAPPEGSEQEESSSNVEEDLSQYPSRQSRSEGESSERIGTGEQSTTREDQVRKTD